MNPNPLEGTTSKAVSEAGQSLLIFRITMQNKNKFYLHKSWSHLKWPDCPSTSKHASICYRSRKSNKYWRFCATWKNNYKLYIGSKYNCFSQHTWPQNSKNLENFFTVDRFVNMMKFRINERLAFIQNMCWKSTKRSPYAMRIKESTHKSLMKLPESRINRWTRGGPGDKIKP